MRLRNVDPEVILFDFDGTLVDSEVVHRQIWLDILRAEGVTREIAEEEFLGLPASAIAEHFFGRTQRAVEACDRFEAEEIRRSYEWMSGAREFVRYLGDAGYTLGIVTNSRRAKVDNFLRAEGMETAFDHCVTCDMVEKRKPFPEPYLAAIGRVNVSTDRIIAVEDSATGEKAALAAGLECRMVAPEQGYTLGVWKEKLLLPR
ncbi:HAD family hydrolase [Salidesulfovibrio onnuriiensis]|uniref:HAD family hydrolase n=1 Tax=Salidesulfovibrio onnuriiensis TaxID=2583823 RepID=UPI0011C9496B|nr:HAD family phosphatase [Salidesulfovibrio onnuriiensis]